MSLKKPSHPGRIEVVMKSGSYASYAIASRSFAPGEILTIVQTPTLTSAANPTYSSVQVGPKPSDHVELNSDVVYINHSCDPNLEFHAKQSPERAQSRAAVGEQDCQSEATTVITVRVARRQDANGNLIGIKQHETLSFFYPSTEWDMAQAFQCLCQTPRCLGKIQGAKYLPKAMVLGNEYFINEHILQLKSLQ